MSVYRRKWWIIGVGTALRVVEMRNFIHWLILGIAAFLPPIALAANTYYVSPSGSDNNSCTSATSQNIPKKSLNNAFTCLAPGDTLIAMDGRYDNNGAVTCGSDTCQGSNFHPAAALSNGGTSSAWITIKAQHKWGAVLDCMNLCDAYIVLNSTANFVSIEDFDITRAFWDGVHANDANHDVRFKGNHFHHIGNRIYTPSPGGGLGIVGVYMGQGIFNYTFDGNIFNDMGRLPGGDSRNDYNHDHGIYAYGNNVVIFNNIFYNNRAGWGIQISPGASNFWILNNTFAFANPQRDGQILLWGAHSNMIIQNNIFYAPRANAIYFFENSERGCSIDHNLTFGAGVGVYAGPGCAQSSNITGTDPKFVNVSNFDFHLSSSSSAIDKGLTEARFNYDFDGGFRPNGTAYDLGAYEFSGTSPSPSPSPTPAPAATDR